MFTLFLSILFSTSVLAAPTQSDHTVPWSSLKNDKSLARFQSNLLNQSLLTFLNDCYSENVSTIKVRIPCSRYFDAILQLNSTNFVVSQPMILKLFNESSKDKEFCYQKHTFPDIKNYPTVAKNFSDPQTCGYLCLQENTDGDFVPKPICAFLVWMGEEIKNSSKSAAIPVQTAAANVNNPSNISPSHMAAAVSKELGKPDVAAAAENTEVHSKATNAQTNISAQTSAKKVPTEIQKPVVKPKQDSIEPKEGPVVGVVTPPTPAPVAAAAAAAAAASASPAAVGVAVPVVKEEKKKPVPTKEDQEVTLPTLGSDTQEEDTLLVPNQDKHDSLTNNQQSNVDQANENDSDVNPNEDINLEDEDADFDLRDEKLKPNSPPLASLDDNEGDQKNSQEIIDHNILTNTNQVTDPFLEESGSDFFTYFLIGMFLCIVLYVVYHNKSKILALLLEGRRSDKGRSGRRKHTAAYRKLDSNLEEAITSSASGRTTQIIY